MLHVLTIVVGQIIHAYIFNLIDVKYHYSARLLFKCYYWTFLFYIVEGKPLDFMCAW